MSSARSKVRHSNWFITVAFVAVVALAVTFAIVFSSASTAQNLENRVVRELSSTAEMQVSALEHRIEDQYTPLKIIANMLENGGDFAGEDTQPALRSITETYVLCMLGFADMDGNVVNYEGEPLGNISDRTYFRQIVSGEAERYCEYFTSTKLTSDPRVLFSIPAYRDGKMLGVLFCSKEISVLEDSLFGHNKLFDDSSITFVCTAEGKMIVANETARRECFAESDDGTDCTVFEQLPDIESMYREEKETGKILLRGEKAYASLVPLNLNDWMLGCIVNEETAAKAYGDNLANIEQLSIAIVVVFVLALGCIILLACVLLKKSRSEIAVINRYYENYSILLREMNCTVVEHNPADSHVFRMKCGQDPYGIKSCEGSADAYENFKRRHPEFDFFELKREVALARKENKTHSFESIISVTNGKIHWVRVILVPVLNENNAPIIFVVISDITDAHDKFGGIAGTLERIPGGIHRCYLNDPIHLEYFSEGLCKMLGYTYEEVVRIVMPEQKYSLLICREDRPVFAAFAKKLAASGGIETCEYRMICRDGSLLQVSDTMDAQRSSSGIMYGYSVVTDLRKYKQTQEQLEQELAETRQQLAQARIKNSSSQMQPHFLYNALASIREIVLEDPEYAAELLYDFTTHLRACIRSMTSDNFVPFTQELENIRAYVNIEKMRFGKKLTIEYDCQELDFEIIPLSIQPLVENAIRHGVYERGLAGGTVRVSSYREESSVVVLVEDDGVGFDFEAIMGEIQAGRRDSTGLFNLIFRLELLLKAKVAVESRIGIGTRITVTIPEGGAK